jgi:RNA polymerase sigma factor (TIGR02999 family)
MTDPEDVESSFAPHDAVAHVTRLLREWHGGNAEALDQVIPLVYDELKRLASRQLRRESGAHTVQPTALVHEAYERLVGADVAWADRVHFFAIAARTMRRVLVEHARARRRLKRGGDLERTTFMEEGVAADAPPIDVLDLERALEKLAALDERKQKVVELHFYGGLTYDEIAAALDISPATVHRDLRMAKSWLHRELTNAERDDEVV